MVGLEGYLMEYYWFSIFVAISLIGISFAMGYITGHNIMRDKFFEETRKELNEKYNKNAKEFKEDMEELRTRHK